MALLGFTILVDSVFCSATLHVRRRTSAAAPKGFEDVEVQSRDGIRLAGWFARAASAQKDCVIVLHGIGDSRLGASGFASLFLDAGYSVLLPDSRAHGESGGDIVTYGLREKDDVVRWVQWAHQHECRKMFGLGESLGGAVLLEAAALDQSQFQAIVAECAYSDLRSVARDRIEQMTGLPPALGGPLILETSLVFARFAYGVDLAQGSPRESIAMLKTPVLLIHGLEDDRTPPSHSRTLKLANPAAQLWLVPGAGHVAAFATAPVEFKRRVLAWFAGHS